MVEKFSVNDFKRAGKVTKQSDVYTVLDVSKLDNLVVSETTLHPGKETSGHSHTDADEVYFVMSGKGSMKLDDEKFDVKEKDIVLIKRGSFHKVFNTSQEDLVFICVFEKYGNRR
jgi:mannose-6-phosphate isomerase-like protein (cupin superfamily)